MTNDAQLARQERERKDNEHVRQQHARVRQSDNLGRQCANAFKFTKIGFVQYTRHLVQLGVLLVLHGRFLGIPETGLIVPFLHAAQAPWSTVLGAYESLEFSLSQGIFPLLILGIIFLTAVSVGRLFCAWACPFGLIQDMLSYFPFKKRRDVAKNSEYRDIKYYVIAVSLLLAGIAGWRQVQAISAGYDAKADVSVFSTMFSICSPDGTLFAYLPMMGLEKSDVLYAGGAVALAKLALLIIFITSCLYTPRFFCRYVCPMGASLGLLSKFKFFKLKTSSKIQRETLNKTLAGVCPMGVQQESLDYIDSPLCIDCGKCMSCFPKQMRHELF